MEKLLLVSQNIKTPMIHLEQDRGQMNQEEAAVVVVEDKKQTKKWSEKTLSDKEEKRKNGLRITTE